MFAGHYGDLDVKLKDAKLWLVRPNRPDRKLLPLTSDGLFAVEGVDKLRMKFTAGGLQTFWQGDPTPRTYSRRDG